MTTKLEERLAGLDLGDLATPVVSLHPSFGGRRENGSLRLRTDVRAGSLAARGNIVQAYPVAPGGGAYVPPVTIVGGG